MDCEVVSPLLDEWVDDELPDALRASVAAHLEGCTACATELAEISSLLAAARALEPRPAPDQWAFVHAELPSRIPPRRWRPPSVRRAVAAGLLVSAAAAALAVLPDLLWPADAQGPQNVNSTVAYGELERAADRLERALLGDSELDPDLRTELQATLSVLDGAISEVGHAMEATPHDGRLNRSMTRLKRRRLAVLARAETGRRP